jgi:hypothetical protein
LDFTTGNTTVITNANRNHSKQYPEIGGNYTGDAGTPRTHYGAVAFASIGRTDYTLAVDLENSLLVDGASKTAMDWASRTQKDSLGTALTNWTTANIFEFLSATTVKISSLAAATFDGGPSGALQIAGGFDFAKESHGRQGTLDILFLDPFYAGRFQFDATHIARLGTAMRAIDATGIIETDVGYYIGGKAGMYDAGGDLNLIRGNGTMVPVYVRGGILCAS